MLLRIANFAGGNRRLSDAQDVYDGEREYYCDYDHSSPRDGRCPSPKVTEVADQQIAVRREGGQTSQPDQPTDFKRHRRPESFTRIQIWSTSFVKAAADFGKTKDDEHDHQSAGRESEQAVRADERENFCRQAEDTCANDAVDGDGNEVPAAYTAHQTFGSGSRHAV